MSGKYCSRCSMVTGAKSSLFLSVKAPTEEIPVFNDNPQILEYESVLSMDYFLEYASLWDPAPSPNPSPLKPESSLSVGIENIT